MKTKQEICDNWLPRYTGLALEQFGQYILLTNFHEYLEIFAHLNGVEVINPNANMPSATANGITMIDFGMGSPNAATIMDLLTAIRPKAVLYLGKCGGLKRKNQVGDFILPLAAIRNDGTSNEYMPPEVPALPAFSLQMVVSSTIRDMNRDYWTGTVFTTNRRVWEFDDHFKDYLRTTRAMAIDMETATIFTTGFYNQIPSGALLLVSDQPMISEGVKTSASDRKVSSRFVQDHIEIGTQALLRLINNSMSVKHMRFEFE